MADGAAIAQQTGLRTILCAARSGGQGKTTVTQLINIVAQRNGVPRQLCSADFLVNGQHSKLGKLYPGQVTEFGVGATYEEVKDSDDLNRSIRHWDKLGDVLVKGGALVDLGANVIDRILDWAELRKAATVLKKRNAPPIDVCLVCKTSMHSVEQAASIADILLTGEVLPVRKIFVIINEAEGKILSDAVRSKLLPLREHHKIDFLRLPFCDSEVWRLTELQEHSLAEALEWDSEELVERFEIDIWEATSGLAELKAWYEVFEKKAISSGLIVPAGANGPS